MKGNYFFCLIIFFVGISILLYSLIYPINAKVKQEEIPFNNMSLNIGFLNPTFTAAAYHHAFYDFYHKYNRDLYSGNNITTDLNLLTSKVRNNTVDTPVNRFINFYKFPEHVKQILPNSNIYVINDTYVHNGNIFSQNDKSNKTNVFDIILMGHEEYVTQQLYNNIKAFVKNGGVLIALSGNVFYGEVKYDPVTDSVTLVKGHGVEFNGKKAHQGISERWQNETAKWFGGNYYRFAFADYPIQFYNNPFNYSRLGEEETSINVNNKIILNYNSSDTRYPIATYTHNFGKGMSIVTGIASEVVANNPKFLKFFDDLLLKCAIAKSCTELTSLYSNHVSSQTNLFQNASQKKIGLQFKPWGGDANGFTINSLSNPIVDNNAIYRIQGNSSNSTVGFTVPVNLTKDNISLTIGDVLKYGNFSQKFQEPHVSFNFKIKGMDKEYNLIFIHGRPVAKEGWINNNYYINISTHQTKYVNLSDLLLTKNDKYLSVNGIQIAMDPNMVLNPFDFRIT